jgi:hypothetical protein
MSSVTVKLPRVLADMVGGQRSFEACGETVREALELPVEAGDTITLLNSVSGGQPTASRESDR